MTASPIRRAHVVGSLLRPSDLLQARASRDAGTISIAEFKRVEDRAVDYCVDMQQRAGIDVITDGEMRRFLFTGSLTEAVEGIGPIAAATVTGDPAQWHGESSDQPFLQATPVAVLAPMRRRRSLAGEEFAYARGVAQAAVKVTLPSPLMMLTFWSPDQSTSAYSTIRECFAAAADILREEIRELRDLGCEVVQIDAPELGNIVDESTHDYYERAGLTTEYMLTEGLDLINAVADVPGIEFHVHVCRGNNQGRWMSTGGYDTIAGSVFERLTAFDAYFLEYDDYRSGSFEVLSDAPDDKMLVLGLVSTKHTEIESVDALVARVDDASKYCSRDQLAVSPQCGFASVAYGNPVTLESQQDKLKRVAEVARRAW